MPAHATRIELHPLHRLNIIVIMVCTLSPVFLSSHGFRSPKEDGHMSDGSTSSMNCDEKLMTDIFVCVSQFNVSVTDFLLAVGGINGSDSSADQRNRNNRPVDKTNKTVTANEELPANPSRNLHINDSSLLDNANNSSINSKNNSGEISSVIFSDSNKVEFNSSGKGQVFVSGNSSESKTPLNKTEPEKDGSEIMKAEIKKNVCSHQREVMQCTFEASKSLIENPACQSSTASESASADLLVNDQRYRIKSLMEAILGQYDNFCAHECRNNLITEMGTCYETFDLDAKLFMSRESRGAVIGSSSYDVDVFCQNREALTQCLRTKAAECPESDLVLSAIGLDLELMEKGFNVLCKNQYTYLRSLECFESHTPEVGICHSIKHRKIIAIASMAALKNWTSDRYIHEVCRIRLEHIQCDLDAWADKDDEKCDEHILGLKRQLHCSLIPLPCRQTHRSRADAVCKEPRPSSSGTQCIYDPRITLIVILVVLNLKQLLFHP